MEKGVRRPESGDPLPEQRSVSKGELNTEPKIEFNAKRKTTTIFTGRAHRSGLR